MSSAANQIRDYAYKVIDLASASAYGISVAEECPKSSSKKLGKNRKPDEGAKKL